ncbi:hypothetical protein EDC24_2271 [Aquisalibacillus elongatus]|uniref:Uncharacterized protein n=1 Tax=Aquisalibacillus elongatus TaxID=485577 RepID=A0A3N5BRD3_9BACI|nr:hypothetical protein EDC24_2271 [Aquisalibacillus elongatus]
MESLDTVMGIVSLALLATFIGYCLFDNAKH